MNHHDPVEVLNRLLRILYRSLPVYLAEVKPWSTEDSERGRAIEAIAADQLQLAQRVAGAVLEQNGRIDTGHFPVEFTDKHDLATDYLVREAFEHQQHDLAAIQRCVADLHDAPSLRPLAEEALGAAIGHLENLKEIMNEDEGRGKARLKDGN